MYINMAYETIDEIEKHMTIKVKDLGVVNRFNGIDMHRTRYYAKINNATYLRKILADKKCNRTPSYHKLLLMSDD